MRPDKNCKAAPTGWLGWCAKVCLESSIYGRSFVESGFCSIKSNSLLCNFEPFIRGEKWLYEEKMAKAKFI